MSHGRFVDVPGVTFNFVLASSQDEIDRGIEFVGNPAIVLPAEATMLDLLTESGFFPSKGQARKNWKGQVEIPFGYSEHLIGKGKNQKMFYVYKEGVL